MAISVTKNSFIASGGLSINLSSIFSITAASGNPTYLVLNGLDRNEYTISATGATGTFSGNGATAVFGSIGGDGRGVDLIFTYQAATGRYYSSMYGYFDQITYKASASISDVTNLSLYSTNNFNLATAHGNDAYAMAQLDPTGYIGSVTIATQPEFANVVPSQATPDSICSIALSFVGKAWNMNGCWVLASTIAAEAGASLPVDSSMIGISGQSNGEWFVAFDGTKQSGNWQSLVKAGEIIVIGSTTSGHITTCVSGSGSTATLIDNITYVNTSGATVNLANDGSKNDVLIASPHLASQEWAGILSSYVKIYELDTPIISTLVSPDKIAVHDRQPLSVLFSAMDPNGKSITQFQIYDTASTDTFIVNGVTQSAHSASTAITVTSLTSTFLQAGSTIGSDTVDVRAYNGSYWGDWQTLLVSVVTSTATPTIANQTVGQTWTPGQHVSFSLPGNTFVDPSGQTLSYTATQNNGQVLPSWLTFKASTATFSGIVPIGTQSFGIKVTATDTSGLSASETFNVAVPVPAPILTHQTANQVWADDQKISFTLPSDTFTDPQGQHLSFSAYQIGGVPITSWLSFNKTTDTFSGLVPKTAIGTVTLEVIATDTSGMSVTDVFNVTFAASTTSVSLIGLPPSTHGMELIPL